MDLKNITTVYSSKVINIVIIFLGVLISLLIIKIFHIKFIQYKQNKKIKKKQKEEEEEKRKLTEKLKEQDQKQKDREMNELNIDLNLPEKNLVSKIVNEIPGVPTIKDKFKNIFLDKKRGILHQVSDCGECDLVLCDKTQLIDEAYPEDHFRVGKPLKEWGCDNTYKDIPKIYDKISGKIYVLEKLKENITKESRIKPTIHLINNCNECDNIKRDWCDKHKYIDNHKNVIDHYNVGVPLNEYGCDKVNKDSEVVRDSVTDNIYVIQNITEDKHKDYTKYNDGFCQNEIIGSMENPNIDVCFNRCSKEEKCNYISFDNKNNLCNRYSTCDKIKTDIDSEFITYKKKKSDKKITKKNEKKLNKLKKELKIKNTEIKKDNNIIDKFKNIFNKNKIKSSTISIDKYNHINMDDDQKKLIELLENNENEDKIKLLENIIENKKDLEKATNEENYELAGTIHNKLIENQKKYNDL